MSTEIGEAKRKFPLPALMHHVGLGAHAKESARCPFHDDQRNSFSVWKNGAGLWFWKCHSGCGEGDEITSLEKYRGISNRDAIKLFLEMACVNGAMPPARKPTGPTSTSRSTSSLDWRACVAAFTDKHVEGLAKWRGYSIEFCSWLKDNELIGLYDGCIAFPIRDQSGSIVAAHYKPKSGETKWLRYPKGFNTRPIVIGQLLPGEPVYVFESQWDAFAFMDVSDERSGTIITLGAENGKLIAGMIPVGATVYAWKQNDELKKGKRAGDEWLKDVADHAHAKVLWPKIPPQFKDLNVWTGAGASGDDLFVAIKNADVICEPEKSWIDALNESVVTAAELHNLKLVPRKKLLGEWFCEGDLGFIFAVRGVGKTWLALAIARALSSGGKLGDWEAHERAKVLYIDGEMPPDSMRDRCQGLQGSNDQLHFLNHEILFQRTGKVLNITNRETQEVITQRCVTIGGKGALSRQSLEPRQWDEGKRGR
jgi:hypothetical protein